MAPQPRRESARFARVRCALQQRPRLTREDVLDGRDVAELLHMPISTVLEYARRGLLPARKLGRRWIFIRDEIEAAVRRGIDTD
jgi:Helix-turn-helix domain